MSKLMYYRPFYTHNRDHTNDLLIDDIQTFVSKPELYFACILKLENEAGVTKCNHKELAL